MLLSALQLLLPLMPPGMLPPREKDRAPGSVRLAMAVLALAALATVPQRAAGQECADASPNCGSLGHLCHVANVRTACQLSCGICVPTVPTGSPTGSPTAPSAAPTAAPTAPTALFLLGTLRAPPLQRSQA